MTKESHGRPSADESAGADSAKIDELRELLAPLSSLDVDEVTAARILATATSSHRASSENVDYPAGLLASVARRWRQAEPLMAFAVAAVYMTLALRAVFLAAPGSM